MTCGVVLVQFYVCNTSRKVLKFLPQRMHETGRTVLNKTTQQFPNVKDKFNKSFKYSIEQVTYSNPM